MSHPENTKAQPSAQQAKTRSIDFCIARSGYPLLRVNPDVPLMDVMRETDRLLDGLSCLLKQLADDCEGELNGMEIHAIGFLVEAVGSMHGACTNSLEAEGGEA